MPAHHKIDYVEFSACDIPVSKAFFSRVFGWTFEDFGSEYTAFANAGIEGGFFANNAYSRAEHGSALIVLYSDDLEKSFADIVAAGGTIAKRIFAFPGGRRFHFSSHQAMNWRSGQINLERGLSAIKNWHWAKIGVRWHDTHLVHAQMSLGRKART